MTETSRAHSAKYSSPLGQRHPGTLNPCSMHVPGSPLQPGCAHRMCRRVAPSALSTLTPSSLTACSDWLPLKTTSMGEMGWPSLYSRQELTFTAGQHKEVT